MSWDIEYTVEIDFKNQGIKAGNVTPFYNGAPKEQVEIEDDGTAVINLIKNSKKTQQLKVVVSEGQAVIDLTQDESRPQFSGGGVLEVEVRSLEIPKQVVVGEDGEEKSRVEVTEDGNVRDSSCCNII